MPAWARQTETSLRCFPSALYLHLHPHPASSALIHPHLFSNLVPQKCHDLSTEPADFGKAIQLPQLEYKGRASAASDRNQQCLIDSSLPLTGRWKPSNHAT